MLKTAGRQLGKEVKADLQRYGSKMKAVKPKDFNFSKDGMKAMIAQKRENRQFNKREVVVYDSHEYVWGVKWPGHPEAGDGGYQRFIESFKTWDKFTLGTKEVYMEAFFNSNL